MDSQLSHLSLFFHLKSSLLSLLPNLLFLQPSCSLHEPTPTRPTFLVMPFCYIPNKPKSFFQGQSAKTRALPVAQAALWEEVLCFETVGALSMSWLFQPLHLPRDAGAESDFERTDPTTFFAVQVLLEPFLKTLALQHWLLQKSPSVEGNPVTCTLEGATFVGTMPAWRGAFQKPKSCHDRS